MMLMDPFLRRISFGVRTSARRTIVLPRIRSSFLLLTVPRKMTEDITLMGVGPTSCQSPVGLFTRWNLTLLSNVVGGTFNRESIGMICNVTKVDVLDDHLESLQQLTLGCAQLRVSEAKGNARANSSDVGTMFAIGTRIPYKKKDGDL